MHLNYDDIPIPLPSLTSRPRMGPCLIPLHLWPLSLSSWGCTSLRPGTRVTRLISSSASSRTYSGELGAYHEDWVHLLRARQQFPSPMRSIRGDPVPRRPRGVSAMARARLPLSFQGAGCRQPAQPRYEPEHGREPPATPRPMVSAGSASSSTPISCASRQSTAWLPTCGWRSSERMPARRTYASRLLQAANT